MSGQNEQLVDGNKLRNVEHVPLWATCCPNNTTHPNRQQVARQQVACLDGALNYRTELYKAMLEFRMQAGISNKVSEWRKIKIAIPSHCCANAVICLIIYVNNCESAWNVSFYCISGEKIQIQVYCISDTDTRYRSRTYLVISGFRHPGTYPKKTVGFLEYTHLKKPTPKKPTLLL